MKKPNGVKATKITGLAFGKALSDVGLIPPKTARVILDASVDGALLVTFDTIGGEEWTDADARKILAELRGEWDRQEAERRRPIDEVIEEKLAKLKEIYQERTAALEEEYREKLEQARAELKEEYFRIYGEPKKIRDGSEFDVG